MFEILTIMMVHELSMTNKLSWPCANAVLKLLIFLTLRKNWNRNSHRSIIKRKRSLRQGLFPQTAITVTVKPTVSIRRKIHLKRIMMAILSIGIPRLRKHFHSFKFTSPYFIQFGRATFYLFIYTFYIGSFFCTIFVFDNKHFVLIYLDILGSRNGTNAKQDTSPFDEEEWDDEVGGEALVDTGEPGVPVRALYDYEGAEADELSFKQGSSLGKLFFLFFFFLPRMHSPFYKKLAKFFQENAW